MNTNEIAARLVELCRNMDFDTAQKELFSPDAVSIELQDSPAFQKETKGLEAIAAKAAKWNQMVQEMHSISISTPLVVKDSFACTLQMDLTMKEGGRMEMSELCVYQVKDGKIITEEFFM